MTETPRNDTPLRNTHPQQVGKRTYLYVEVQNQSSAKEYSLEFLWAFPSV